MTRHQLDTATVATLTKVVGTKKGRSTVAMHRARYYRAMEAMGISDSMIQYHGFNDCYDMAMLNEANANYSSVQMAEMEA